MIHPGEDLPFTRDAFAQSAGRPIATREFNRDATVKQAVVAFRFPYRGHSPFTDISKKAPRANDIAGMAGISSVDICDRWQNSSKAVR
jgi:hypothetical protein